MDKSPVQCGAVPPLADGYVTRPESAPDLDAALIPGTTVVLTSGHAGAEPAEWLSACGKTQHAVAFAEQLRRSRQVDLVLWVCAASRTSVLAGYSAAATALGTGRDGTAESAAAGVVSWLRGTSTPWLIVLDDLRNAADLEGLWPEGPAGRVLVTTAGSVTVAGNGRAPLVPMGAFSTHEALRYLMGRLSADPDQRLGAIDLVAELGCEPMALAQASAVIASSELSCRQYQEHFARRRDELAAAAGPGTSAAEVTWTLSAEHADRLSPGGAIQPLLALVALLDSNALPATVLTAPATLEYLADSGAPAAAEPVNARDCVLSLERAGLLTVDPATFPPTVRISPAVQQAVVATVPEPLLARAVRAAAHALLETWPEGDQDQLEWPAPGLLACAASVQQAARDMLWQGGEPHPLLLRTGLALDRCRLTGPAVAYWTDLVRTSDRVLGASSPDTLTAGSHLAQALAADGQVAEAVSWTRWVQAGRARILGVDAPDTNGARIGLGRALLSSGQPAEAISVLEGAAAVLEQDRGAGHADTLDVREELAAAYTAAGKPGEAIELYQRALGYRERALGQQHPGTLTTRQRLADAYLAEGRVKDGISQYRRVVADRERVLGPDHPDTLAACASLAAGYRQAGRMPLAVQFFEQAHAGYERVLGPDHLDTLAASTSLAAAYHAAGRPGDAAAMLRDTVSRCERVLPPRHPLTETARERLTSIADGH